MSLTEYLVALGLIIGGVIGAVMIFGEALAGAFRNFADYILTLGP